MRSGSVSICMEMSYSPEIHQGHTSTTAADTRTHRDSAVAGMSVYIRKEKEIGDKQ